MKKYILLVGPENDVQILEGFFDTVDDAKQYAKEQEFEREQVHIYELAENAYDLAQND